MEGLSIELLLEKVNFSKGESIVYLDLLKNGASNGSQIASRVELPKPSVYLALEKLYSQGSILSIQGKTRSFVAEHPTVVLEKLESRFLSSLKSAKEALEKINRVESKEEFFHILGYDSFCSKIRQMISSSSREIYMNTNIDLTLFEKELQEFTHRGGRVIVYSFGKEYEYTFSCENHFDAELTIEGTARMICVCDYKECIMSCGKPSADYMGIYTKQMLQVTILSENIHNDIYKIKLKKANHYFVDEVRLHTLAEGTRHQSGYKL